MRRNLLILRSKGFLSDRLLDCAYYLTCEKRVESAIPIICRCTIRLYLPNHTVRKWIGRRNQEAPEPAKVLEQFVMRIAPKSWNGPRTAIIEERLELLKQMEAHPDPSVAKYVSVEYGRLRQAVEDERTAEKIRINMFDQTFE